METLLANKYIAYGTIAMAIFTGLSFVALCINAYLFQRQIKSQGEQINAMNDLRRRSIKPALKYHIRHENNDLGEYWAFHFSNEGEQARRVTIKRLKEEGIRRTEHVFDYIEYFHHNNSINDMFFFVEETHRIVLQILIYDMDDNYYVDNLELNYKKNTGISKLSETYFISRKDDVRKIAEK